MRTREKAQWINCLPCKHEDLSFHPSNPCTSLGWRMGRQSDPWNCQPACPNHWISGLVREQYQKRTLHMVPKDTFHIHTPNILHILTPHTNSLHFNTVLNYVYAYTCLCVGLWSWEQCPRGQKRVSGPLEL